MSDPTDNLTPKQHKAVAALMSTPTISAAAAAVGVNERTIYTWLDDLAFSTAYRAARREAVQQATARLQQASSKAVDTLVLLLDSSRPSIQLGAASKILDLAAAAVDRDDLIARIEALEVGRHDDED